MAEENLIKRIQPQSTEAEQTVIGSMILDNECIPNMQNVISDTRMRESIADEGAQK